MLDHVSPAFGIVCEWNEAAGHLAIMERLARTMELTQQQLNAVVEANGQVASARNRVYASYLIAANNAMGTCLRTLENNVMNTTTELARIESEQDD